MRWLEGCAVAALLLTACDSGGGGTSVDAAPDRANESDAGSNPDDSPSGVPADGSAGDGATANVPLDCGAPPGRSTSVTGSVGGVPVGSTEAIGVYGTDSMTGVPYAGVWIWNRTGTCALVQGGTAIPPNTTLLTIELARTNGSAPFAPGTYPYGAANGVPANGIAIFVHFEATDSLCGQVLQDGVGGVVTLDAVCGSTIAGSFDLLLSMGGDAGVDEVTGTFNAPVCNFDMNNFDQNAPPAGCPSGPDL